MNQDERDMDQDERDMDEEERDMDQDERDMDQDEYDAAARLGAKRPQAGGQGPAWPLENDDLYRRPALRSARRAARDRRPHQWRELRRLCRAGSRPNPEGKATSSCSTISALTRGPPSVS